MKDSIRGMMGISARRSERLQGWAWATVGWHQITDCKIPYILGVFRSNDSLRLGVPYVFTRKNS